jgi:hypothetical protein
MVAVTGRGSVGSEGGDACATPGRSAPPGNLRVMAEQLATNAKERLKLRMSAPDSQASRSMMTFPAVTRLAILSCN